MKEKQQLPAWFDGEVYEVGDMVRNPFSGESTYLTAEELSMYDVIKGAEIVLASMPGAINTNEVTRLIRRGLNWFLSNNPHAYMVLLD